MWWVLGLGCDQPDDPRSAMRESLVEARPVELDAEAALREGRLFEACVGFKQRVRMNDRDEDWPKLLLAAARDPECLSVAQGDALSAWGKGREGWADAVAEWEAGQHRPVDAGVASSSTRLRLALRGTDGAEVRAAAEVALRADPRDAFACGVLVRDALDRGELAEGESVSHCAETPGLLRMRAEALDAGGRWKDAVDVYDRAGFGLHAAAILYQSLGDDAGALARMEESVPPVAIHRGWMTAIHGGKPDVVGLDGSPEATMLRALAGDPAAIARLPDLPGLQPLVLHARLTGRAASVESAIIDAPHNMILLASSVIVSAADPAAAKKAAARSAAADLDHLLLAGTEDRREAPWAAIAPTGEAVGRAQVDAARPRGQDDVGESWRFACTLGPTERDAALLSLQEDHPELRVLARLRARKAWRLPPLPEDVELSDACGGEPVPPPDVIFDDGSRLSILDAPSSTK